MTAYKNIQSKITEKILWCLLILSPVIILLVQSAIYGRNLFLGVPEWSDELDYWRELYSFSNSGFSFGSSMFFGYDAKFGPLGAHSISPIVAWGPFFWLFRTPLGIYAILWINLLYLTLAWVAYVFLTKPNIEKSIYTVLLAYFYPFTILYLHSSMLEFVCMAGIIVYFTLLYKWYVSEKKSNILFICILLVGIWCTLLRPTYVVILFPAIWMKNDFKINLKVILSMIAYVIAFAVFYKVYGLFCADYPGWITSIISDMPEFSRKLMFLFHNAKNNVIRYFSPIDIDLCQLSMRYFYFSIIIYSLIKSFTLSHSKKNSENTSPKAKGFAYDGLYLSLAVFMFVLWAMMMILYDTVEWHDFRALAPISFGVIFFYSMKEENKKSLRTLAVLYALLLLLFGISRVSFVETKEKQTYHDMSAYFDVLEPVDEDGNARTIGVDLSLNWCDISVLSSISPQMGYQVFYYNSTDNDYIQVDYVFFPEGMETDLGEYIITVPGYGNIYKMY